MTTALYNPAAPGLAPRIRPPVLSLFRARSIPQPEGCKGSNAMTLQDFLEPSADAAQKNSLLAGKSDTPKIPPKGCER